MNRFIVEKVLENLKCHERCDGCPRIKLRDYIEETGVDEFAKLYTEGKIPEDIVILFKEKERHVEL